MNEQETLSIFQPLWGDIEQRETFPQVRPHLAHYTSIPTLENIVANDELWFSNPLNMNDFGELRFVLLRGAEMFRKNWEKIRQSCQDQNRYEVLSSNFENYFKQFDERYALDTYIFCLSKHDPDNTDGRLSMWRGYGGNGNGAAIIIDTSKINVLDGVQPLIFSKVEYLSDQDRHDWIDKTIDKFVQIINVQQPPTEMLHIAAHELFERFKLFALFTKHHGFHEEEEWRVVYLRDRDVSNVYASMLGYAHTARGIEPKFKYKVQPIKDHTAEDFSLEKIISQIILGPTTSSCLAAGAVCRMLEMHGKRELVERVVGSTIPFRPQ